MDLSNRMKYHLIMKPYIDFLADSISTVPNKNPFIKQRISGVKFSSYNAGNESDYVFTDILSIVSPIENRDVIPHGIKNVISKIISEEFIQGTKYISKLHSSILKVSRHVGLHSPDFNYHVRKSLTHPDKSDKLLTCMFFIFGLDFHHLLQNQSKIDSHLQLCVMEYITPQLNLKYEVKENLVRVRVNVSDIYSFINEFIKKHMFIAITKECDEMMLNDLYHIIKHVRCNLNYSDTYSDMYYSMIGDEWAWDKMVKTMLYHRDIYDHRLLINYVRIFELLMDRKDYNNRFIAKSSGEKTSYEDLSHIHGPVFNVISCENRIHMEYVPSMLSDNIDGYDLINDNNLPLLDKLKLQNA